MNYDIILDRLHGEQDWNHHFATGSDNVKLHYVRKGEGTPVLLLHGWPGFWYDWRHLIEPLSQFADVIAPDFRGFGESEKVDASPLEGYTPDHLAGDIISLLNGLHIKSVIIVAHDIGATIAQHIAKKYPEYVNSLVLLNPPYNGIGSRRFDPSAQGQFWYQHFHNLDWAEELIGYNEATVKLYLTHFYRTWTANKTMLKQQEMEAIISTYAKNDSLKTSIKYYKARAQAKTKAAIEGETVKKINQRTSVLWGEEDPVMLVEWSDRLCDYFEHFTLETLPGIGHFVPFEAPDQVIAAVRRLIK